MNKIIKSLNYTYLYDLIFPVMQIMQTVNWYAKGKHSSPPHFIKQKVVKSYQRKYKPQILIETGTYLGAMVNAAKNNFKRVYTIELDRKLYNRAKNKFKKKSHIEVFWGDSTQVLPKLLKKINKPCLFWLDAHYSKGITAKGIKETPIMDELTYILNHRVKTHVILIDDSEMFTGKNGYPILAELKKLISNKNPDLHLETKYNIIIITPV